MVGYVQLGQAPALARVAKELASARDSPACRGPEDTTARMLHLDPEGTCKAFAALKLPFEEHAAPDPDGGMTIGDLRRADPRCASRPGTSLEKARLGNRVVLERARRSPADRDEALRRGRAAHDVPEAGYQLVQLARAVDGVAVRARRIAIDEPTRTSDGRCENAALARRCHRRGGLHPFRRGTDASGGSRPPSARRCASPPVRTEWPSVTPFLRRQVRLFERAGLAAETRTASRSLGGA